MIEKRENPNKIERFEIRVKNQIKKSWIRLAKARGVSPGKLMEIVYEEKLTDPVKILNDEIKELAMKINEKQARRDYILKGEN